MVGIFKLLPNILGLTYSAITILVIYNIVRRKGRPSKTIAWLLVVIFIPFLGLALYGIFGRNYRKQKIYSRKSVFDEEIIHKWAKDQLLDFKEEESIKYLSLKPMKNIVRLLLNNDKALLTVNNRIKVLNNGDVTFLSILEKLEAAAHHIHLEYYIIESDEIGNKIKDLLIKKAKQGVEVRVIFDEVGSWGLANSYINDLEKNGVEILSFMPIRFPKFASKINYRNHRKIIVIDGVVGFVGGINISDRYIHGDPEIGLWRDTHLMIEGDAVKSLQTIFLSDWQFVSNKTLTDEIYFPITQKTYGEKPVQIVASGPDSDWASIMQTYFSAITSAKKFVFIVSPYFIPNESILTALKIASLSGVDVRILLPFKSDSRIVHYSTHSYFEELYEAGIKIYMYAKGFIHSKIMIVDGTFSSVGTANLDIRSFDENFEVNAIIYDNETNQSLIQSFYDDLLHSIEVKQEYLRNKTELVKFLEASSRILSPLL